MYKQIQLQDCIYIEILLKLWFNATQIALKLWFHRSSISREIKRYSQNWVYNWFKARNKRKRIRSKANTGFIRIAKDSKLEVYILQNIKQYWSAEQIAWRRKLETWKSISKDTIYKYIYEKYPWLIKKYFRRKWKKYKHYKYEKYQIVDRKMIDKRSKIVETRERIWKNHKWAIYTLVERKPWILLSDKLRNKSADEIVRASRRLLTDIDKSKLFTITYDNGREFAENNMIEYYLWVSVYFAHPYHSRERWTNENTNWLLRQFIPKWTSFDKISQSKLDKYVSLINNRPRKRLNYQTPIEVFHNCCTSD